jgi:hypothetical protein
VNEDRAICRNARPHVSSPSPFFLAQVLEYLLQSTRMGISQRENAYSSHTFLNQKGVPRINEVHLPSDHICLWRRYLDQSPTYISSCEDIQAKVTHGCLRHVFREIGLYTRLSPVVSRAIHSLRRQTRSMTWTLVRNSPGSTQRV